MGVIKRVENLFEIRCAVSEETLYLPSSDDDEYNYPQYENERQRRGPRILRQRPPPVGPAFSTLKNHSGKKKFRRYHNANQLITLAEEDELNEVTINDFMGSSKSPFSVLLEDDKSLERRIDEVGASLSNSDELFAPENLMPFASRCIKSLADRVVRKVWDELVSSSEEKQRQLIDAREKKKTEMSKQPVINKALRSLLRRKNLPIGMLHYLEEQLISFFLAEPTKTYISPALSSFERLLLHSVSTYHRLVSLSFVSEPENVKLVRVKNPRSEFPSPPLLLVQYLESTYGVH